jgi:hypothetical protein
MEWIESVKNTNQLAVYDGIGGGRWANVFKKALGEFNKLSRRYGLGIRVKDAGGEGGAQVLMRLGAGAATFEYDQKTYSSVFDKAKMHGSTHLVSRRGESRVEKAFIFLPSEPQISTPNGIRDAGINILTFIAVHELIHACGLHDSDHGIDGVFYSNPGAYPGDTPKQDKVTVTRKVGSKLKISMMPELFLDNATVATIQRLWK